nr:MAG: structural protein [Totiviridae sp.]
MASRQPYRRYDDGEQPAPMPTVPPESPPVMDDSVPYMTNVHIRGRPPGLEGYGGTTDPEIPARIGPPESERVPPDLTLHGLRHVCSCAREKEQRAYYLRPGRMTILPPEWKSDYPWLPVALAHLEASTPDITPPYRSTYIGAVSSQLFRALDRLRQREVIPSGPYDSVLREEVGRTIEYTPVPFPDLGMPVSTNAHRFWNHQQSMAKHLFHELRLENIDAQEWSPPPPSDPEDEVEEPQETEDPAPEPVDETEEPSEESTQPDSPGDDTLYQSFEAGEGWGGEPAEKKERVDRGSSPIVVVEVLKNPSQATPGTPPRATASTSTYAEVTRATQTPTKAVKIIAAQAKRDAERRETSRTIRERVTQLAAPAAPLRLPHYRPQYEEEMTEPTRELFFEDGPTSETDFEAIAYARIGNRGPEPKCLHWLYEDARSRHNLDRADEFCKHVKLAVAVDITRHPDEWGIGPGNIQLLGALVDMDVIKDEWLVLEEKATGVKPDSAPPTVNLQERYTVEVYNRFDPLFEDDINTLELTVDDYADMVATQVKEALAKSKRPPTAAGKKSAQAKRQREADEEEKERRKPLQDKTKTRAQRKQDGLAALRRIAKKINNPDLDKEQLARTILRGGLSCAVRNILAEYHHWLRYPAQARANGQWCWLAACSLNSVAKHVTLAGSLSMMAQFTNLCHATGTSGWIRDLSADGDVEKNPGPGPTTFPIDRAQQGNTRIADWATNKEGLADNMAVPATMFVRNITKRVGSNLPDVNYAVIAEGNWTPASEGAAIPVPLGTWTAILYPSTISDEFVTYTLSQMMMIDRTDNIKSVPTSAQPTPAPLSPPYRVSLSQTGSVGTPTQDEVVSTPARPRTRSQTRARAAAEAAAASQPSTSGGQATDQTSNTSDEPEPEQPEDPGYPSDPNVIVAGLTREGLPVRVARARGDGVALPLHLRGTISSLHAPGHRVNVVVMEEEGLHQQRPICYARRVPITMVQRGPSHPAEIYIGSYGVAPEDTPALAALKTDTSPSINKGQGVVVYLIGEWYPGVGNTVPATQRFRGWGPPMVVYGARTGMGDGTSVTSTILGQNQTAKATPEQVTTPRFDVTETGLDATSADRLARLPPPTPTTCEANALKLGLMWQWASYGSPQATTANIFTGQLQVHEPNRHIVKGSAIKRHFNSSGCEREDCGGLITPTFPFLCGFERGAVRFYATAQAVPDGARFLLLPFCFEKQGSFAEAAIYILSFLRWPWGNMSLSADTADDAGQGNVRRLFTWYGATTVVPGETVLNVVLHVTNYSEAANLQKGEPRLGVVPTMGGTAVEFWQPWEPIPVNYKADQHYYVPAASFAASWAMSFEPNLVANVLAKINNYGLFDNVERWVFEGPAMHMGHSGIMAVAEAHMRATRCAEGEGQNLSLQIAGSLSVNDNVEVPLMYRCWAAAGNRIAQVESHAVWTDVEFWPDTEVCVPDIITISQINSGFYAFDKRFGVTSIRTDATLLTAYQYLICEKMFVGWHLFHATMGLGYSTLSQAQRAGMPGQGETVYFAQLFDNLVLEPTDMQVALENILERVIGGKLLTSAAGASLTPRLVPPRRWESPVYDLEEVAPLEAVTPTPLVDAFVFKYADSLPAAYMPFVVSRCGIGNVDLWNDTPAGTTREGYVGPDIYAVSFTYDTVGYEDQPNIADSSIWENRLMVSQPKYRLYNYQTYDPVPSAPPQGYSPISIPRGRDSWVRDPVDLQTVTVPYPFFSTVWSAWMDSRNRGVAVLMTHGSKPRWMAARQTGTGLESDGYGFNPVVQPLVPGAPFGRRGPGAARAASFAGNVKRGVVKNPPPKGSDEESKGLPNKGLPPPKHDPPALVATPAPKAEEEKTG